MKLYFPENNSAGTKQEISLSEIFIEIIYYSGTDYIE